MDKEQFKEFVEGSEWTFAKTMPWNPHYWLVREGSNRNRFKDVVEFIWDNGKKYSFYSRIYICYDCGEWYYWSMRELGTDKEQYLINRAEIKIRKAEFISDEEAIKILIKSTEQKKLSDYDKNNLQSS